MRHGGRYASCFRGGADGRTGSGFESSDQCHTIVPCACGRCLTGIALLLVGTARSIMSRFGGPSCIRGVSSGVPRRRAFQACSSAPTARSSSGLPLRSCPSQWQPILLSSYNFERLRSSDGGCRRSSRPRSDSRVQQALGPVPSTALDRKVAATGRPERPDETV